VIAARRSATLILAALLTGCAALTLHRALRLSDLLPVVAVAVFGPTMLIGLAAPRLSAWLTAPLSTVAWLVAASVTILHAPPDPVILREALTTAGPDLLTTILPAPATPPLLVAVSALAWLTASASAELVARTRSALAPALPPVLLFLLALVVGVAGPGSDTALAAGFVALAAMLAVVRRPPSVRSGRRRYIAAVPVVAVVAGAGFVVGPLIPHGQPFDPRGHVQPAGRAEVAVSPLDQVSAWLATPDLSLFTTSGQSDVDWRIGSLDAFDGQTWTITGRFVPTGGRVPGPSAGGRTVPVSTVVTVTGLTGSWVPAHESPTAVSGPAVVVDPQTGVLIAADGLAPGLRYAVDSRVPVYDADQLRSAVPASDAAARTALVLPAGMPPAIVDTARLATDGATFPVQQATRLASYLRQTATNDPSAPPGHSYGHLLYFLTVSHRGTTEQFGAAFAVMARALGLPTRLAVGFGPGRPGPDGLTTVRGADALVWPEVEFSGIGWVPFYPTPATGTDGDGPGLAVGASGARREVDDTLDATAATDPSTPLASSTRDGSSALPPVTHGGIVWILVAGLLVAYLGAVLIVPPLRRRRRRRSARDGSDHVAAAWNELLRLVRPLRLGDVRALTTAEVAAACTERLGPAARSPLDSLAAAADAAAFGAVRLPDHAGAEAWRHVSDLGQTIRRAAGLLPKLSNRLTLR
jgi:transglutaminase-like putative cysteine protease